MGLVKSIFQKTKNKKQWLIAKPKHIFGKYFWCSRIPKTWVETSQKFWGWYRDIVYQYSVHKSSLVIFWNWVSMVYITQCTDYGGVSHVFTGFSKFVLLKLGFLSDQEVPGYHKNIYRELRPSFTRSKIFGNICCCFRQQRQHCLLPLHLDISLLVHPK